VKLFRTLNDALQGFAVYDDAFRVPGRKRYNNQVRFRLESGLDYCHACAIFPMDTAVE